MMNTDPMKIPGVAEAIAKERFIRDAAFLTDRAPQTHWATETVGGFECQPMTPRHYVLLRIARSPLVYELAPDPIQLATFLWILSPQWTTNELDRIQFLKRCRFFCPSPPPFIHFAYAMRHWKKQCARRLIACEEIGKLALAFVAETMQDRPPRSAGAEMASYYSDACFFCAVMAREYHWPQEYTLNAPLKQIFQYLNERKQSNGSKVPLSNPSDLVVNNYLVELNRRNN